MFSKRLITNIISFFLYVLFQIVIFKNVVLFDKAFAFIYIGFLLMLPIDANKLWLMILAFITGMSVDIFYDSLGIHIAACVFIMFIRNYWLNLITPQGGYDSGELPTIKVNGLQWFTTYTLPLIFIHHTILFYIEAAAFGLFWFTLSKVFYSTIFTFILLLISQYLFYNQQRRL